MKYRIPALVLLFAGLAACARQAPSPESVRAMLPQAIEGKVSDIRPTGIGGLYEATIAGQIIYVHPESGLTVVGNLVTREGKSLTGEARTRVEAAAAAEGKRALDAALDQAVTIGAGRHQIVELTDPDCPFCRKLDEYLAGKDVTRKVFFRALPMHPGAPAKIAYILAGKGEAEKRLRAVFGGAFDGRPVPAGDAQAAARHGELSAGVAVGGTPLLWIDGQFVHGLDKKRIDELLAR